MSIRKNYSAYCAFGKMSSGAMFMRERYFDETYTRTSISRTSALLRGVFDSGIHKRRLASLINLEHDGRS